MWNRFNSHCLGSGPGQPQAQGVEMGLMGPNIVQKCSHLSETEKRTRDHFSYFAGPVPCTGPGPGPAPVQCE